MSTRICGHVDVSIYLVVYGSNGVSERLDAWKILHMRYLDNFLGTVSLGSASIPHRDRIHMLIGSTWQNITDKPGDDRRRAAFGKRAVERQIEPNFSIACTRNDGFANLTPVVFVDEDVCKRVRAFVGCGACGVCVGAFMGLCVCARV